MMQPTSYMDEPPQDAPEGDYESWQQWLLGQRVAAATENLRMHLAAINGHNRMDAADLMVVAINRLECAYSILGYELPPLEEQ